MMGAVSEVLDLLSKYGFPIVVAAIVIVFGWKLGVIITAMVKRKLLDAPSDAVGTTSSAGSALIPKPDTDPSKRQLLTNHTMFTTIEQLLGINVPRLECGCEVRTELLRDMMTVYLETWRNGMQAFVTTESVSEGFDQASVHHATALETKVTTLLCDIQVQIRNGWIAEGVPLAAVTAFDRWHSLVIEMLIDHTKRNASSPFYPTNRQRLVAVMSQCALALSIVTIDAKITLKRMNGTLDGVPYKGRTIGPIGSEEPHPSQLTPATPEEVVGMMTGGRRKVRSGEHKVADDHSRVRRAKPPTGRADELEAP